MSVPPDPTNATMQAMVIVAGGKGTRLGNDVPKQFLPLGGLPLVCWSTNAFLAMPELAAVQLVLPPGGEEYLAAWRTSLSPESRAKLLHPVTGGAERHESVLRGIEALPPQCAIVAVHDGARPFPPVDALRRALEAVTTGGHGTGALLALPATDTVKLATGTGAPSNVEATLDRQRVWLAQTPQVAWRDDLIQAYRDWPATLPPPTDEAQALERMGCTVALIPGDEFNRKVTRPADLAWARWIASLRPEAIRS